MNIFITILMLMNAVRAEPLVQDPLLMEVAQVRAEQLCERKQWSHDGWEDAFANLPLKYQAFKGENLARGFKSPLDEFVALMNSPKHEHNMTFVAHDKVGFGSACGIHVYLFA